PDVAAPPRVVARARPPALRVRQGSARPPVPLSRVVPAHRARDRLAAAGAAARARAALRRPPPLRAPPLALAPAPRRPLGRVRAVPHRAAIWEKRQDPRRGCRRVSALTPVV